MKRNTGGTHTVVGVTGTNILLLSFFQLLYQPLYPQNSGLPPGPVKLLLALHKTFLRFSVRDTHTFWRLIVMTQSNSTKKIWCQLHYFPQNYMHTELAHTLRRVVQNKNTWTYMKDNNKPKSDFILSVTVNSES